MGDYRNGLHLSICPLHISWTLWKIFIKLWSNVRLSESMCRTHKSTMPTQGQSHRLRSWVWALSFVSAPYLLYPWRIFFKLWSYFCLSEMMCRTDNSTMLTQGQGHRFEPWNFVSALLSPIPVEGFSLNLGQMLTLVRWCAESITQPCQLKVKSQFKVMGLSLEFVLSVSPLPLEGFSLNFGQMFTCGTMCRTHNSATGTQGQGHSSRSRVWALNFVSTWYLLYPWKDFLLILVKCLPQWNDVQNP